MSRSESDAPMAVSLRQRCSQAIARRQEVCQYQRQRVGQQRIGVSH
ncbi:MAG: hypothetical protein LH613_12060 [Chamaesiphon sp.]|nr:hypothetical protein [Chamaesiphon sp.]